MALMTQFNGGKQTSRKTSLMLLNRMARVLLVAAALAPSRFCMAAEATDKTESDLPLFQEMSHAQWYRMLPDLGDASPQIAILHVDPKSHRTELLIRSPRALH